MLGAGVKTRILSGSPRRGSRSGSQAGAARKARDDTIRHAYRAALEGNTGKSPEEQTEALTYPMRVDEHEISPALAWDSSGLVEVEDITEALDASAPPKNPDLINPDAMDLGGGR